MMFSDLIAGITVTIPLRLLKRQSPTTVLFKTTLTRTITTYELRIVLSSKSTISIQFQKAQLFNW